MPVICDKCRAEGSAGDEAFAGIPDILDFEPVPRRAHVNAWTPEHQRAFIAALAITGSPTRAARAIGRHAWGADKMRRARGGRPFSEAWEAALDLARERELARLKENMADLSEASETELMRLDLPRGEDEWDDDEDGMGRYQEAQQRIRERLLSARRLFLAVISSNPEMRAAWEVLCGPVDWDKADRLQPQDNEPFHVIMRKPDMLLPVEWGLLPDVTGGPDGMAQAFRDLREEG